MRQRKLVYVLLNDSIKKFNFLSNDIIIVNTIVFYEDKLTVQYNSFRHRNWYAAYIVIGSKSIIAKNTFCSEYVQKSLPFMRGFKSKKISTYERL